ncbi:MAG: DNA polymerase III subunit gamma/tau [bacterium]|nr:DNA polymerase III subunit gamma/tau [bacterium]
MAQALYRKYRPTSFSDVVNQAHVKTTLLNEIESKQFAHAYLFAGPRGVGKTTIARLFAHAVNADSIKKFNLEGTQLIDIIEIDAASHTGVDNVRENVIQNAYAVPTQLQYKVFIIDEVHMLSASAFNALLKILEEPPAHVVFILATTEAHKIPATVISRCQRFDFHTISLPDIVKRLQYICENEGMKVATTILERIARRSDGAIRDAESMLGQIFSIGEKEITDEQADIVLPRTDMTVVTSLLEHLVKKEARFYLEVINTAVHDGMHLMELHSSLMDALRQCMLYTIDKSLDHFSELDVHTDVHAQLIDLMKSVTTADCITLIDLFTKAGQQMYNARILQLPLETAGITWCGSVSNQSNVPVQPATKTPVAPVPTQPAPSSPEVKQPTAPQPVAESINDTPTISAINNEQTEAVKKLEVEKMSEVSEIAEKKTVETDEIVPEDEPPAIDSSVVVSVDTVKGKWKEIISATRQYNHALAMSLSLAHVISVTESGMLQLGTRFAFHKERLGDSDSISIVQKVIKEIMGYEIANVSCIVDDQYEIEVEVLNTMPSDNISSVEEVDNVWDLALNTFGGEENSD